MASAEQRSTVWSRAVKLVKTVRLPLTERISLPESVISTGLLEQLAAVAFGDEGMLAKLSKEKPEYSQDISRKEATVMQLQSHGLQRNAQSVLNGDEHSVYEAVKIAVDNLPSSMLIAEKEGTQHNESTDVHKNDDGLLLLGAGRQPLLGTKILHYLSIRWINSVCDITDAENGSPDSWKMPSALPSSPHLHITSVTVPHRQFQAHEQSMYFLILICRRQQPDAFHFSLRFAHDNP
jgi:hypothetical protein